MMYLKLIHGRKSPEEQLDNWGFEGPVIGPIKYVHATYFSTFTVGFYDAAAMEEARKLTGWGAWDELTLEMKVVADLVKAGDGYFGDWELSTERPDGKPWIGDSDQISS